MENAPDSSQRVRVAVNIRPLVTGELVVGCADCITVIPGEPQVQIGSRKYTFDHVFGSTGKASERIYDECVSPLVDELLRGINGTVLAYGQTGSGKTYIMGTNYNGEVDSGGIIPKVTETIFSRVEGSKETTEFLIKVSFIEILMEEVFDLLDQNPPSYRCDGSLAKPAAIARAPIQIRENCNGGITLAGVTEAEVKTKEEMASYLLHGSFTRATASTKMNSQSSRSHAIFTISVEQKKVVSCPTGAAIDGDDILSAKLHLVDLAGSERVKRTEADGPRLREGIHINKGLLALGNVISALGDDQRRKGGHVSYRDSKLTRLLQVHTLKLNMPAKGYSYSDLSFLQYGEVSHMAEKDSLGGNSKTVMIACVSPAEKDAEETLNTLKYANRARNIQNKTVINRGPTAAQVKNMRSHIEELQTEVHFLREEHRASSKETQNLKHEISLLEARNAELHKSLQECQINYEHARQVALDSQVENAILNMEIESARAGKACDEIDSNSDQDSDLVKAYVAKIQDLEAELLSFQNLNKVKERVSESVKHLELSGDGLHSKDSYPEEICELPSHTEDVDINGGDEADDKKKEQEDVSLQEKVDMEPKEDNELGQKEALMQAIDQELEVTVRIHELLSQYERKIEERARLDKEVAELKKVAQSSQGKDLSNCSQSVSPGARKSRLFALETMLDTTSSTLEAMESQLSEETERAFSGRARWHQVRSLAEAKSIMNYLFDLVSSSRCVIWDKELDCRVKDSKIRDIYREKDSEVRDLKDTVVSLVSQLEKQKATVTRQEKLQNLALEMQSKEKTISSQETAVNGENLHVNDLQYKGSQSSMVLSNTGNRGECINNIYDSEHSDFDAIDDDEVPSDLDTNSDDPEWVKTVKKRAKKRNSRKSHAEPVQPIYACDSESSGEGLAISNMIKSSGVCCSCSKQSMCKRKCECRAAGGSCDDSCSCAPTKCTNRGEASTKDSESLGLSELGEGCVRTGNQDLASQGTLPLQSDLPKKKAGSNDVALPGRKPLSDIGNLTAFPNVPKPSMRKEEKNSVIHHVPSAPIFQPEIIDLSGDSDNGEEIPLQKIKNNVVCSFRYQIFRERNSREPLIPNAIKDDELSDTKNDC